MTFLLYLASPSLRDVHSLVLNLPLINYASSIRISVVELVEVVEVVVIGQPSAQLSSGGNSNTSLRWRQMPRICPIIQDVEGR